MNGLVVALAFVLGVALAIAAMHLADRGALGRSYRGTRPGLKAFTKNYVKDGLCDYPDSGTSL